MGLSINNFTYVEGVTDYDLNFALGYASQSDISVYKDGENPVDISFDWLTDTRIRIDDTDLTAGDTFTATRTVSKTTLPVDLTSPGNATRENLETIVKHTVYLQHELLDGRFTDLTEVDDAVYQQVISAVDTALDRLLFLSNYKFEQQMPITLDAVKATMYTTGDYRVSPDDSAVFVTTPPNEPIEVIMYQEGGDVFFAFNVDIDGTVEVTTSSSADLSKGAV